MEHTGSAHTMLGTASRMGRLVTCKSPKSNAATVPSRYRLATHRHRCPPLPADRRVASSEFTADQLHI